MNNSVVLKENGDVVKGESGNFVPADVVAAISGVSLRQIRRVLAALDAIERAEDVDFSELININHLPTALPDQQRVAMTTRSLRHIRGTKVSLAQRALSLVRD